MMSLIANSFLGAAAAMGAIFGFHGFDQFRADAGTTTTTHPVVVAHHATSTMPGRGIGEMKDVRMSTSSMPAMPVLMGKVTAVDGSNLTVLGRSMRATATSTYSVDASGAKILKQGVGTTTIASVKTGDMVAVMGLLSGTTVTAKLVLDGMVLRAIEHREMEMHGQDGMHDGMKIGSSTGDKRPGAPKPSQHPQ